MRPKYPWWLWCNLASLDAPIVALVWQEMFARMLHSPVSGWHRWILALTTWVIYAADRVFDSLAPCGNAELPRHEFAKKHRILLSIGCCVALGLITWIAFFHLKIRLQVLGLIGVGIMVLYFFRVHKKNLQSFFSDGSPDVSNNFQTGLWKEFVVAMVFAFGVVLAPVVLSHEVPRLLIWGYAMFAAVVFVNCGFITRWESANLSGFMRTSVLSLLGLMVLGIGVVFSVLYKCDGAFTDFSISVAISSFFLFVLDCLRERADANLLRVLADVALLSPVGFLIYRGF